MAVARPQKLWVILLWCGLACGLSVRLLNMASWDQDVERTKSGTARRQKQLRVAVNLSVRKPRSHADPGSLRCSKSRTSGRSSMRGNRISRKSGEISDGAKNGHSDLPFEKRSVVPEIEVGDNRPVEEEGKFERRSAGEASSDGKNYVKLTRTLSINDELPNKLNEPTYTAPRSHMDPWCDPDKPRTLQFEDINAAASKIRDGLMKTPCTRSQLSSLLEMDLYFKKEFMHVTGSFKERGARYTLLRLSEDQKKNGVIAASAGNHALALAYHGQLLGVPVTVIMPLIAPLMKITLCRQYGAAVLVQGADIGVAKEIALKMAEENGYLYVNGYDHPHILSGQGTVGLEIVDQVNNIDAVIIPVGGAGLIAGAALALKQLHPSVKVIGVEGDKCPSLTKAMEAGRPVYAKVGSTIADGLSVPMVGYNAFATVKAHKLLDDLITVQEEHLALAILKLIEVEKAVVEGGGAAGLAAILAGRLPYLKGKRVVCVLTGGNIDTTILGRAIERALAVDGRLIRFAVVVSDRPGGIAELTGLLARVGASIKDINAERACLKDDIFNVRVKLTAETRDKEHTKEVGQMLNKHYADVIFNPIMGCLDGRNCLEVDILVTFNKYVIPFYGERYLYGENEPPMQLNNVIGQINSKYAERLVWRFETRNTVPNGYFQFEVSGTPILAKYDIDRGNVWFVPAEIGP